MYAAQRDLSGPTSTGRAPEGKRTWQMADLRMMPSALQVARAMAEVLRTKLAVFGAEEITLTRKEAALCLGLAEGGSEHLDKDEQASD